MKINKVTKIKGSIFTDERGSVSFVNDFNLKGVKRFYQVENINQDYVRAFHGHMKEAKYVWVVSGSILLCTVFLDNVKNPSKENEVERIIINSKSSEIIYIPPSYANGFRALEPHTKVIFFSTSTVEESKRDDYRFPEDYWGKEIWEVNNG